MPRPDRSTISPFETERTFTLDVEDEAALLQAITEADRGDLADGPT